MLVAIHQPNFFPWMGYFDKIRRADVFIFLDAVDYPRAGSGGMGSWCNRVQVNIQEEARWVTCPLKRATLGTPINAIAIDDGQPWRAKLLRTLDANYRKAAHYHHAMALLEPLIVSPNNNLATFNIAAIQAIAHYLGMETRFVRQSSLSGEGRATDLLISLVRAVDGQAYLAGGGAGGYQQDEAFAAARMDLVYQGFEPRSYGKETKFIAGLSIIDYLMHDGRPLDAFMES
ncbi:MAG: wbmP [Hyphomicrobiales bacterium]|nr:MAG: wbmP [Hyphomicrobiales bacterium]